MSITNEDLIADARLAVLPEIYRGLSGTRRSTKRDAVEAAFPYAMEHYFGNPYLFQAVRESRSRSNFNAEGKKRVQQQMYDHVYRRMTSAWTWFLLWMLIRGSVWRLVVSLVEWLLKRETNR